MRIYSSLLRLLCCLTAALLPAALPLSAQIAFERQIEFGGAFDDLTLYDIVTGGNGDLWVCGEARIGSGNGEFRGFVARLDSNGTVQLARSIGDTIVDVDGFRSILHRPGGEFFVTGFTGAGTVLRLDASGQTDWAVLGQFGGHDIAELPDGDLVLTGTPESKDMHLVRITPLGDTVWTRSIDPDSTPLTIAQGLSVLVHDSTIYTGGFFQRNGGGALLAAFDFDGDTLWTRRYKGPNLGGITAMAPTPGGGLLLGGYWGNFLTTGFYLARTDASGNILWARRNAMADSMWIEDLVMDSDGAFTVVGSYVPDPASGQNLGMLMRFDANGQQRWARSYGRPNGDIRLNGITRTDDGGYALAGRSEANLGYHGYVVKTDAMGRTPCSDTLAVAFGDSQLVVVNSGMRITAGLDTILPVDDNVALSTSDSTICTNVIIHRPEVKPELRFSIAPNPFRQGFVLMDLPVKVYAVSILRPDGQVVYQNAQVARKSLAIDGSTWPAGLYFCRIRTPQGDAVRKLVKY